MDLHITKQMQHILDQDERCPKCGKTEGVDMCWANGETGRTGWDCTCGHCWETPEIVEGSK